MSVNNKFYFSMLLGLMVFAASTVAQVSDQPPVGYGMTPGRFVATASALIALIGVVVGVLALFRPAGIFGTASGRLGAIIAVAGGLIGVIVGGVKAATSSGIGTGGGLAGAVVAVVLGLVALVLGGLALSRSRS